MCWVWVGGWGCLLYVGDCQCALFVFAEFDEEHTSYVCCLPVQVVLKELGQPEEQNIFYFKKNYRNTETPYWMMSERNRNPQRQVHASLCISCLDASFFFLTQGRNEHSPSLNSLQPPRMDRPWLSVIHPPTPNSMAVSFYSKSPSSSADLVAPS